MKRYGNKQNPGIIAMLIVLLAGSFSCKKFIGVPAPETELVQELVFKEDATALSAMAGIYSKMAGDFSFTTGVGISLSILESVYADEMRFYSTGSISSSFYSNDITATNGTVYGTWTNAYDLIYSANRILEGLGKSTGISDVTKKQLMGEALFVRAFCHFYLVNLFGDVPYISTTDYIINTTVSRTATELVYKGIIADLLEAKNNLSDAYPGTGKRVRVNKAAATALLARTYLYHSEWPNAEAQATAIINNTAQYELPADLNAVFLKNSNEAIWQIMPGGMEARAFTNEGAFFILTTTPSGKVAIADGLFNAFETTDERKLQWTDTVFVGFSSWYYPYKYKATYTNPAANEYTMVLRLAEQYLIRAEARAQQDKLTGPNSAEADINAIRNRAGLANTTAVTKSALLTAIEQERRVELFTEWGHRFFDLKRWGRLDAVLGTVKGGWNTTDALWPVPQAERLLNAQLTQNAGY